MVSIPCNWFPERPNVRASRGVFSVGGGRPEVGAWERYPPPPKKEFSMPLPIIYKKKEGKKGYKGYKGITSKMRFNSLYNLIKGEKKDLICIS